MIPLRDNVPTRRFPIVCVCLIVLNVIIFVLDQLDPHQVTYLIHGQVVQQTMGGLSLRFAMIPAYVTGDVQSPPMLPLAVEPAWVTIFTSMFLHANWLHIGGNMLYLWIFGNNIEDVLGRGRFILFYLISGLGAAALQIVSDPASPIPTVGASGAIAGLMGAYIVLYPGARVLSLVPLFGIISTLFEVPALLVIGQWILIQVVNAGMLGSGGMLTRGGGVAYMAHIGGFAIGMLLIVLFGGRGMLPPQEGPLSGPQWPRMRGDNDDRDYRERADRESRY